MRTRQSAISARQCRDSLPVVGTGALLDSALIVVDREVDWTMIARRDRKLFGGNCRQCGELAYGWHGLVERPQFYLLAPAK